MSEVLHTTQEELEEVASHLGLICIFPSDTELAIDDDYPTGSAELKRLFDRVNKSLTDNYVLLSNELITESKTKRRHHYYKLNISLPVEYRIALQAALGSDPVKEALSLLRHIQGSTCPTAMFETPKEAQRIKLWRNRIDRQAERDAKFLATIGKTMAESILDDDVPF